MFTHQVQKNDPFSLCVISPCLLFQQEIVLVEGSRVFESWKRPPPPVYMEFFFFNVTNAEEIVTGAKPVVNQVGPYTYRYVDDQVPGIVPVRYLKMQRF